MLNAACQLAPHLPPAESGSSLKRNMLLLRHYWHRIGGTALAWFVWDFAFYGERADPANLRPGALLCQYSKARGARHAHAGTAACLPGPELRLPAERCPHPCASVLPPAGNKLFQSTFIKIINPDSSLIQVGAPPAQQAAPASPLEPYTS